MSTQLMLPAFYPDGPEAADTYFEDLRSTNENHRNAGRIDEIYGSFPFYGHASGRRNPSLPAIDRDGARAYVARLRDELGIAFRYVFNSSCLGAWEYSGAERENVMGTLADVIEEIGITRLVLCNTNLVEVAARRWPSVEISVSTINDVTTVPGAARFAELGASRVVVSKTRLRDFVFLGDLYAQTDLEVEVMLNQGCPIVQPFCRDHYNFLSHIGRSETDEPDIYFSRCLVEKFDDPAKWLKTSIVRPEDLGAYTALGPERTWGKIVGRERARRAPATAAVYLSGSFDGNLLDLVGNLDPASDEIVHHVDNQALEGFLDFWIQGRCDWNCADCDWCDGFARNAVTVADADRLATQRARHLGYLQHLGEI
ncbi:MAG: hypothetical protein GY838_14525 [bacterium]|nr:hypothetical protein [bacterium]